MLASAASERRGVDFYQRQDYPRAITELRPLAEGGSAGSQYYLAMSQRALLRRELRQGSLVPIEDDPVQSQSHGWFGKAAAQGHADAMAEYALDFDAGYGVAVDYAQAAEWMHKAHAAGSRQATMRLQDWYRSGHIVKPDAARAEVLLAEYEAGRPAGDGGAAGPALSRQLQVLRSTLESSQAALESRSQQTDLVAAEAGHAEAALRLGDSAASIVREQPDCPAATRWYRRAGDLGLDEGYYKLGIILSRGACGQDLAQARELFEAAARRGNVMALKELARMHLFGHLGSPDYQQAYVNETLYQQLADIDDAPAPLAFARRHLAAEQLAAADAEAARLLPDLRGLRVRAAQATTRQIALGDPPADAGWSYTLTMIDRTGACARNYLQKCDYVPFQTTLVITNPGASTLACTLQLAVHFFGEQQPQVLERRFVTLPGASRTHGIGSISGSVDAQSSSMNCSVVEQPSMADGTCAMQLPPGAGPTYPADALRRGQAGLVRVEFMVSEARARPSQAAVVVSSGVDSLDRAAVEFLSGTIIHTNCPGVLMIAPVEFRLQD
jgi:TonB family protein